MAEITLTKTCIRAGLWKGVLSVKGGDNFMPDLDVTLDGISVNGVQVLADANAPGRWFVSVPIPVTALADGVQTFLFSEKSQAEALGSFTIITGEPLSDDIHAEVELLRAELDMLKRAFRRHCVETRV